MKDTVKQKLPGLQYSRLLLFLPGAVVAAFWSVVILLDIRLFERTTVTAVLFMLSVGAAAMLIVWGVRNRCAECGRFYGLCVLSKSETGREQISWTEKKNVKGLATNSYCETAFGELIQYDVVMKCRFCKCTYRQNKTVRRRL